MSQILLCNQKWFRSINRFDSYDNDDRYSECVIRFVKVIGFEYSLIGFGIVPESYDSIIEISDSDWLKRTEQYNKENDYGLYQVLANEVVISDGHRNEQ